MKKAIFVFSTSSCFDSYHRKREVEALSAEAMKEHGSVTYFNRPSFILSSRGEQKQDGGDVAVKNLFTLLPLSVAFKNNILLLLFVKLPILLQLSLLRLFMGVTSSNTYYWYYKPDQYCYLPRRNNIYVHYDNYADDKSYFFSNNNSFDDTLKQCVENSQASFFCSRRLMDDSHFSYHVNVHVYPNAVDRAMLNHEALSRQSNNGKIQIGFVGQLDASFDIELTLKMVAKFSDYDFVFIGPVKIESYQQRLSEYENVTVCGYVEYGQLSGYLLSFDLALCLYSENGFNRYRNPLKIYEYFSYGIPVVTTDCDIEADLKPLLTMADSHDAYLMGIESELSSNSALKIKQRRSLAKSNCWDDRAKTALATIWKKNV